MLNSKIPPSEDWRIARGASFSEEDIVKPNLSFSDIYLSQMILFVRKYFTQVSITNLNNIWGSLEPRNYRDHSDWGWRWHLCNFDILEMLQTLCDFLIGGILKYRPPPIYCPEIV